MAIETIGVPVICIYCARKAAQQKHGGPLPVAPMHFIQRPVLRSTDTYKYTVIRDICPYHHNKLSRRFGNG